MIWTAELDLENPGTVQYGKDWNAREVLAEAIENWLYCGAGESLGG